MSFHYSGLLFHRIQTITRDILVTIRYSFKFSGIDDIFDTIKRLSIGQFIHDLDDVIWWLFAIGQDNLICYVETFFLIGP